MKAKCPFCFKELECDDESLITTLPTHERAVSYQYEDCRADWYTVDEHCPGSGRIPAEVYDE